MVDQHNFEKTTFLYTYLSEWPLMLILSYVKLVRLVVNLLIHVPYSICRRSHVMQKKEQKKVLVGYTPNRLNTASSHKSNNTASKSCNQDTSTITQLLQVAIVQYSYTESDILIITVFKKRRAYQKSSCPHSRVSFSL